MHSTTLLGIVGGFILVLGAAWPDRAGIRPLNSVKDWLFAVGGGVMFAYSILNYISGGSVFFVFLEALVVLSTFFMMIDLDDRIDTPIIAVATVGLIAWSLLLLPDLSTLPFIIGLAGVAIGYCSRGGTVRREVFLFIGSALIALFSYLSATWVFFWLNAFFALFSAYQVVRMKRA